MKEALEPKARMSPIKLSFWPTHSKPTSSRAITSSRGILVFGERLKCFVNSIVYGDSLSQVQLRLSRETLEEIDRWVAEGRFKSRSDAIKTIISFYEEREKTREFFKMLMKRSEEVRKHPESLVPLEEL